VLAGRCSAADALAPGPAGTLLLADRWAPESPPDWSPATEQHLLAELENLGPWADLLVVDTGSGAMPWTARLWQRARLALVVTTVDDVAVMGTYATIKLSVGGMTAETDVRVLVNQCDSRRAASDACTRIGNVCRRFLGRTVRQAPMLPTHAAVDDVVADRPRVWRAPRSPFARSVNHLSGTVVEMLAAKPLNVLSVSA
jgi:MinD-like ATPase involved in chromosome partitioning or flagellar assembly